MGQINSYPSPSGPLTGAELVAGEIAGSTRAIPVSAIVEAAILSLLGVSSIASLPNEDNGDALPAAGSGGAYLSGGVLKFA